MLRLKIIDNAFFFPSDSISSRDLLPEVKTKAPSCKRIFYKSFLKNRSFAYSVN